MDEVMTRLKETAARRAEPARWQKIQQEGGTEGLVFSKAILRRAAAKGTDTDLVIDVHV